jgi:hypothetical protein
MQDDMLATSAASYAVNPMSVGKVEKKMTRDEKKTVTVENDSQDVLDPVKSPEGKDNPTTVTLDVVNITTTSILAKCGITDIDGATGICTLKKADGTVVSTWTIGSDKSITGLTPDTMYVLTVSGTAQKKNPDNTLTAVPVNQIKNFKTNAETPSGSWMNIPDAPIQNDSGGLYTPTVILANITSYFTANNFSNPTFSVTAVVESGGVT